MTGARPLDYGWWLASRASGIVALVLVTVSVGIGLAMAGGVLRKPGLKRTLMSLHEQAALAGLVAISVHGATLLGDAWLHPTVTQIVVPFTLTYRTVFTGLGVVAGYLAALLGLSFYVRRRIGARLWRKLHRATVVVYALGVVHAIGAGTDATTSWLRAFLVITGVPIAALFATRVTGLARRRRVRALVPRTAER